MSIVNAETVTLKSREEVLELARTVLEEKPRSYVEAAFYLAKFIEAHQWALPGWTCTECGIFNGEARETRRECRSCGRKAP